MLVVLDNSSKESGDNGSFTVKLLSRPLQDLDLIFQADNNSGWEFPWYPTTSVSPLIIGVPNDPLASFP